MSEDPRMDEVLARLLVVEKDLNRAMVMLGLSQDKRRRATRAEADTALRAGIRRAQELAALDGARLASIANGASASVMDACPDGVIPASAILDMANYLHGAIRATWLGGDEGAALDRTLALLAEPDVLAASAPLPED